MAIGKINGVAIDAGGGDVMVSGTPAASQITVWTAADTVEGSTRFTFDTTNDILDINGRIRIAPGVDGNGELFYASTQMESAILQSVGDMLRVGTAITTVQGRMYDFSGGAWLAADADAGNTSQGLLGVAVESGTTNTFITRGYFSTQDITGVGAAGGPIYVSNTPGYLAFQKPVGSGDTVRQVGYCVDTYVSGRSTYYKMYFNPSNDFVVL